MGFWFESEAEKNERLEIEKEHDTINVYKQHFTVRAHVDGMFKTFKCEFNWSDEHLTEEFKVTVLPEYEWQNSMHRIVKNGIHIDDVWYPPSVIQYIERGNLEHTTK